MAQGNWVKLDAPSQGPTQNWIERLYSRLGGGRNNIVFAPEFTVSTLPSVTGNQGGIIAVSNETGGYTLAFCDGTNWRRIQDRAVVS